jgi:hypothetical protein
LFLAGFSLISAAAVGCSDNKPEPGFRVRLEGAAIILEARSGAKLTHETCQDSIGLEKHEGNAWVPMRDDRPPPSANPGFYLDGTYFPAHLDPGCDFVVCDDYPATQVVGHAEEYVKTGTKAPLADPHSDETAVDVIETRAFHGDVRVNVQYRTTANCGDAPQTARLLLTIPEHGVCCPIGDAGCSSSGPGGGWAPNLDACTPWKTVNDAYLEKNKDSHGCPILIENDGVCCSCLADAGFAGFN